MRAIFLVLVLLNVGFFTNQQFFALHDTELQPTMAARQLVANNLQLLAERDGGAAVKVAPKKVAAQKSSAALAGPLCTIVGPFGQLLYAENLIERLGALDVKSQIVPIEIKTGEVFWVYLTPEMSEKEAFRRLYELKNKSIEGFIITKGDLANGISFGRFADALTAESKVREVEQLGYKAYMRAVPQTISETWVMLNADSDEKINDSLWAELLDQNEVVEKRQNVCLGVASQ